MAKDVRKKPEVVYDQCGERAVCDGTVVGSRLVYGDVNADGQWTQPPADHIVCDEWKDALVASGRWIVK